MSPTGLQRVARRDSACGNPASDSLLPLIDAILSRKQIITDLLEATNNRLSAVSTMQMLQ